MKVFRFSKKAVCLFVSIVYVLSTPVSIEAVSSFGITPPYVIGSDLEPGSVHTQKIYIVRRDASKDLTAEIVSNVPGADHWLSIDKGNTFTIPAGESKFPVFVEVRVPQTVSAGTYDGSLHFEVRATEGDGQSGMISVGLRARALVSLEVVKDGEDVQELGQVAGVVYSDIIIRWFIGVLLLFSIILIIYITRKKMLFASNKDKV